MFQETYYYIPLTFQFPVVTNFCNVLKQSYLAIRNFEIKRFYLHMYFLEPFKIGFYYSHVGYAATKLGGNKQNVM